MTAASLSAGSLSLTVENTGNQSTVLGLVIISPLSFYLGGNNGRHGGHLPDSLLGAANFVILGNGSLVPLRDIVSLGASARGGGGQATFVYESILGVAGYNLTKGSSATFAYTGQIFTAPVFKASTPGSIVSGQQYEITVLGTQAVASMVVTAG
jgi:hypothetical protein